jgi:hypothetical protein
VICSQLLAGKKKKTKKQRKGKNERGVWGIKDGQNLRSLHKVT